MKFFAALIAKLTGGDASPKTLDQARFTFSEAKSALDKIGAMFAAASLDFDAMLTKGDHALKDFVSELNAKVTTAEAKVTDVNAQLSTLNEQLSIAKASAATALELNTQHLALFASVGFKLGEVKGKGGAAATAEEIAAAFQQSFTAHVSGAVTQKVQEIGFPAAKLPSQSKDEATKELSYEEFSKLSPAAKMEFSTNGGRLTTLPVGGAN
jgi:uncharacterized coiled-coil protein SlyX